jgi:predicted dehydrogenase
MKPVVWGILSVSGHYGLRVHTNVTKSPLVEMRAVASRSKQKAAEAAAFYGMPKSYGSYEDLLADREIEAVYIPVPNHMHAEWVKKAADAGKHILCEKPFALNARDAEEAIHHAESKGVMIMEAGMYRLHPQWKRAREIVRSGEIGEVHTIHTSFCYSLSDPTNIRNILSVGGGAIYDVGYYAVSSARFLLGKEPLRVLSLVHRDPRLKTDTLSSGILDFGTTRAIFTVATQTFPWQCVDAAGSGGHLTVHLPFNAYPDVPLQVSVSNGVGSRTIDAPATDQYVELFEGFSRAVREGGPVPTPPQDAIDNMKVLDALFRSEKSGAWEKL